ncbi:biotin transporter BioY [Brevibacterium litoralis]|uniref:biotin transporter BioY n=1 Tax=Brevibacterium litoralis TaxID=3138935 RepID=UPI0032EC5897
MNETTPTAGATAGATAVTAGAAPAAAATDRRTTRRSPARDLAYVAVFAALIAVFALMPGIPLAGGVPITLQTLAVGLCGLVLGPVRGFLAAALYVAVGLLGVPIFAQFSGGVGVLAGPTVGYLLAFPLFALVCGLVSLFVLRRLGRVHRGRVWVLGLLLALGALVASFATTHPLGILGMSQVLGVDLRAALFLDMPFWPGDVIKCLLGGLLAALVHRAFPQILRRP